MVVIFSFSIQTFRPYLKTTYFTGEHSNQIMCENSQIITHLVGFVRQLVCFYLCSHNNLKEENIVENYCGTYTAKASEDFTMDANIEIFPKQNWEKNQSATFVLQSTLNSDFTQNLRTQ